MEPSEYRILGGPDRDDEYVITIKKNAKTVKGKAYNTVFNMKTGFFARWGVTMEDDPQCSPIGPELLDIEISTICHQGCPWCYKANTGEGKNMTLGTFRKILEKMPPHLSQIAFGIGDINGNPDLWKIFELCREKLIVPNVTINGYRLKDEHVEKLVSLCGAVAVSHYDDDTCFGAVDRLTKAGLKQVNIHQLLAKETYDDCIALFESYKNDDRLKKLNAIVFLSLKQKGRGVKLNPVTPEQFDSMLTKALELKIPIGFDSCTAPKTLSYFRKRGGNKAVEMMIEPCESSCFSFYINVDGIAYPCSFLEGEEGYHGIDMTNINDFLDDAWFSEELTKFRNILLEKARNCPRYTI